MSITSVSAGAADAVGGFGARGSGTNSKDWMKGAASPKPRTILPTSGSAFPSRRDLAAVMRSWAETSPIRSTPRPISSRIVAIRPSISVASVRASISEA